MDRFYIDESGNTGDVIKTGNNFDFGSQPLFALSAIGINDLDALNEKIDQLKKKHKIQQNELKSTKIYKSKPDFIYDLVEYVKYKEIPFFIELVDKKYYICSNIVNCVIISPLFKSSDYRVLLVRNLFADFIYSQDATLIYNGFINCCMVPTEQTLLSYMVELKGYFEKIAKYVPSQNMLSEAIANNIGESIDDLNILKHTEKSNAFKRFIPIPDENKNGKDVWLLPNLSSFTNIYARINKYKRRKLSEVMIIHDEQAQFDKIITNIHDEIAGIDGLTDVVTNSGDYNFVEKSQLQFIDSKDSIAVQVADVLSGFVMRYVQDSLYSDKPINSKLDTAFSTLKNSWSDTTNVGINFVFPKHKLEKF